VIETNTPGVWLTSIAEPTLSDLERLALEVTAAALKVAPKGDTPLVKEVPGARWHRDGYYATLSDYTHRPPVTLKPRHAAYRDAIAVTEVTKPLKVSLVTATPPKAGAMLGRLPVVWHPIGSTSPEAMPDLPPFMARSHA